MVISPENYVPNNEEMFEKNLSHLILSNFLIKQRMNSERRFLTVPKG